MDKNIINKLVKASGVSEGELILIHFWGDDSDKSVANEFMAAVAALGASPVLLQQSRVVNKEIFSSVKETTFSEKYFSMFNAFDAVLDVFAYQPVILGYEIEASQFELYRKYMAQIFGTLTQLKRFTQIRIPTLENAQESDLDPDEFVDRMTQAYDIDYNAMKSSCEAKLEALKKSDKPVLFTGEGCELSFDLTGREWLVDAGDGDLPCGEVYIAPVEEKTQGSVFFEKLFIEEVGVFEQVTLTIADGRAVSSNNDEINQFLTQLPENGNIVCELGLGMNANVKNLCGYTVLDEKMADTFHIALGANVMFGGQNDAPNHIDLVGAAYQLR